MCMIRKNIDSIYHIKCLNNYLNSDLNDICIQANVMKLVIKPFYISMNFS